MSSSTLVKKRRSYEKMKRLSKKGNTSHFEIYENVHVVELVLVYENICKERTCLQLVNKGMRLPKDYNHPVEESEAVLEQG